MTCTEEEHVDTLAIRDDRLSLLDLGLFSSVEFEILRDSLSYAPVIRYRLSERPTLLLLPLFELDQDNQLVYGAFLQEENFRGRHDALGISARFGGETVADLSYAAPWVQGRRLRFSGAVFVSERKKSTERILDRRGGVALSIAPGAARGEGVRLSPGWERVETEPLSRDDPDPPRRERDDHRWFEVGAFRDSRLYRARPTGGVRTAAAVTRHGGPLGGDTDFWRAQLDLLGVLRTGEKSGLTAATRATWSEGRVPLYLRLALGGSSTLRGYPSGRFGGDSRWIAWLEHQFPLLAPRRFTLPGKRGQVDVTVDGAIFADFGAIWNGADLARGRVRGHGGGGVGLRVVLPFVQVLRLDLATDGETVRFDGTAGIRL